jgi:hypothetical protein
VSFPVAGGDRIYAADIMELYNASVNRPLCILRRSTVFNVANNGAIIPSWDIEDEDQSNWHSTVTNTGRITPTKAGWIEISATVHFATNATGRRAVALRQNGAGVVYGGITAGSSNGAVSATATRPFEFNGTTDYVEVWAYQNSGGALDTADTTGTIFTAKWLRVS